MRILALDSSGAACSAALWAEGAVRARRFEALERGHAERLIPLVLETMADSDVGLGAVDLFAATTGPGGFTGLRVGLATLRGLALAAGRPMLGVTSLEALAHGTLPRERRARRLLVLIESKRAELYAQAFDETLAPESAALALSPEALATRFGDRPLLLAGDGASRARGTFEAAGLDVREASTLSLVDAAVVAALAAERAAEARAEPPKALYLRAPDAMPSGSPPR